MKDFCVDAIFENGEDALAYLRTNVVNLVFLEVLHCFGKCVLKKSNVQLLSLLLLVNSKKNAKSRK